MAIPPAEPSADELVQFLRIVTVAQVRSDYRDLTARQLALALTVYLRPDNAHTVRGLAHHLSLNKPAITRAVDVLEECGLAKRVAEPGDARSVLITRTREGSIWFEALRRTAVTAAANCAAPARSAERDRQAAA